MSQALSQSFFFLSRERPLDAAGMDGDTEPVGDVLGQIARPECRIPRLRLLEDGDDLGGQLVAAVGPALLGQQPRKARGAA